MFLAGALGFKVNKLDEIDALEVTEFRREAVNLCREIVESREGTSEAHAFYAYSAQVCKTKVLSKFFHGVLSSVTIKVWVDSSLSVSVKVQCEANADTVIREALDSSSKKLGVSEIIRNCSDYVLKICGREEYLLGMFPILQYKVRNTKPVICHIQCS